MIPPMSRLRQEVTESCAEALAGSMRIDAATLHAAS
jgi:hypothetical protein